MTPSQLSAIRERLDVVEQVGGIYVGTVNFLDDLRALLAEVERLTAEVESKTTQNVALMGQNGRLHLEVERLTAERDDLKSAVADLNAGLDAQDQVLTNKYNAQLRRAEKAEAERDAAFRRGVAAMREAAAHVKHSCGYCSRAALQRKIRALPDPEDKP